MVDRMVPKRRAETVGTTPAPQALAPCLTLGHTHMRLLLALIIIVYLVGVGVVLSPVVRQTWSTEPASVVAGDIGQALPDALAWPVRAAHAVTGS
jgi:hypothetical protein